MTATWPISNGPARIPGLSCMQVLTTARRPHRSGAYPWVVPITIPGMSGLRLLLELRRHGLETLPEVIYLDSAHEAGETLLELELAFSVRLGLKISDGL